MNILFLTDPYPSPLYPGNGIFVYNFVQELAKQGHQITLITPVQRTLFNIFKRGIYYGAEAATVFHKPIFTASAIKIGPFNTYIITHYQKKMAVKSVLKKIGHDFDFVYCHFTSTAMYAVDALKGINIPLFVAVGENKNLDVVKRRYSEQGYASRLGKITAFIAVSEVIKNKLIENLKISPENILLAPNGTDLSYYHPRNKTEMRKKYGFPQDKFILAFVGRFIHSKGPLRVIEAAGDMEDVRMIFAGKGKQQPDHKNIIFRNKATREQIPELLSAADAFILPTLHEGSNNAIIEAMACGLPVISSDIPEVRVQCTPECSILTDPMNVAEIRNAILKIKNDPELAGHMSENTLMNAKNFDLSKRAVKIMDFIQTKIKGQA